MGIRHWKVYLVIAMVAGLLNVATPSHASICHKGGWTKTTRLQGGVTIDEVYERGSWFTDDWTDCYGRGIWSFAQDPESECYWQTLYGIHLEECTHWGPTGTFWWNDGGLNRYKYVLFRDGGKFSGNDPTSGNQEYWDAAKFNISYDGSFTQSCWVPPGYTVPPNTVVHCAANTGDYNTAAGGVGGREGSGGAVGGQLAPTVLNPLTPEP